MNAPHNPTESQKSVNLVVMAAGMGSRYGGLKQIDPIGPNGENILDYSVYDAIRAGFTKVIFVVREEIAEIFKDKIGDRIAARIPVAYAMQEISSLPGEFSPPAERTKPWGTAHAVLCAAPEVDGPFAAINADDYYGTASFQILLDYLRIAADDGGVGDYSLVGYPIKNTLSRHGFVSRGVCEVSTDNKLSDIVEHTRIEQIAGEIHSGEPGNTALLATESIVSMNLWGFTPSFLDHLDQKFRDFLIQSGGELTAECFLPAVVNELIQAKLARVKVLPTTEQWFGVTYKEDKKTAKEAIAERIHNGQYPPRLWP